jgi:probable HAF family extracellular repeat protein
LDIADGSADGGFGATATAINNSGEVVGSYDASEGNDFTPSDFPLATARAFLYRENQLFDIGTVG